MDEVQKIREAMNEYLDNVMSAIKDATKVANEKVADTGWEPDEDSEKCANEGGQPDTHTKVVIEGDLSKISKDDLKAIVDGVASAEQLKKFKEA